MKYSSFPYCRGCIVKTPILTSITVLFFAFTYEWIEIDHHILFQTRQTWRVGYFFAQFPMSLVRFCYFILHRFVCFSKKEKNSYCYLKLFAMYELTSLEIKIKFSTLLFGLGTDVCSLCVHTYQHKHKKDKWRYKNKKRHLNKGE